MNRAQRWCWKLYCLYGHAQSLNRRVEVENVLIAVAQGKRAPLTREECRDLALKLGTPPNWDKPLGRPWKWLL